MTDAEQKQTNTGDLRAQLKRNQQKIFANAQKITLELQIRESARPHRK